MFTPVTKIAFFSPCILCVHVETVMKIMICVNLCFSHVGFVADDYKLESSFTFTSIVQKHLHVSIIVCKKKVIFQYGGCAYNLLANADPRPIKYEFVKLTYMYIYN